MIPRCTLALAILSLPLVADPGATSSLRLVSGTLAGQAVSSGNRAINVAPGQSISGSFSVQINSTFTSSAVMSIGVTPSWGPHSTSFTDLGHFNSPTSGTTRTINVAYTAPATPGTYYIIAAYAGEFNAAEVMSCTNWSYGNPVWDNGDDIAGWSASTIATANSNGTVLVPYLGPGSSYVPATAIQVVVQGDPAKDSTLFLLSGTLAGQQVSPGSPDTRTIRVNPGQAISGSFVVQINSAFPSSAVMSMGVTPSWGLHANSYSDLGHFSSPVSGLAKTISVNYTAPMAQGTYYITAAFHGEYDAGHVMSCTNWSYGGTVWDNGDDIADWSDATVATTNQNGNVRVPYYYPDGSHQMYVPATAIIVVVGGTSPGCSSSLRLISGTLAGQSVSPANASITVTPGQSIGGSFVVQVNSTFPSSAVMSMGVTPTWGPHSGLYSDLGNFATPASGLAKTISVNYTAPQAEGTYYIVAAYSGEYDAGHVMSCTNWSYGGSVWNDGDDIADWSPSIIATAMADGTVKVPYLYPDGEHQVCVPATAIQVNVRRQSSTSGLQFVAVTPCRVADTRNAYGSLGGPAIPGSGTRDFPVPQSSCGIPYDAQAYSMNVTVVPRGMLSYLSIWPSGQSQPLVSTLNSYDGRIKANAAIVPAGANGSVSVYVTNTTDVILDINGYFTRNSGLQFYPVTPCRVFDTRMSSGAPTMGGGQNRTFPVSGTCSVPASAQAYSVNMTVVPQGALSYLSLWPAGQSRPFVSTLNSPTGAVVANAAIVPAGNSGAVNLFVTDTTDVFMDINGYFAPAYAGGLNFYPANPCRVADTRNAYGAFGAPSISGGGSRDFPVPSSSCAIPSGARAYSLNATVVPQGPLSYLTLWPSGSGQPFVSTLNAFDGTVTANAAIVPASSSGSVSAFATNPTDLILDINGYFAP